MKKIIKVLTLFILVVSLSIVSFADKNVLEINDGEISKEEFENLKSKTFVNEGNLELISEYKQEDNEIKYKEFYEFKSKDDHIFYLVIDKSKDNLNTYLLNLVDEEDLINLIDNQEFIDNFNKEKLEAKKLLEDIEKAKNENINISTNQFNNNKILIIIFIAFFILIVLAFVYFIKKKEKVKKQDNYDPFINIKEEEKDEEINFINEDDLYIKQSNMEEEEMGLRESIESIKEEKDLVVGKCPKCNSDMVKENQGIYLCQNEECNFTIANDNKFFNNRQVKLTDNMVRQLLEERKITNAWLHSLNKDKTYKGNIVMDIDDNRDINYHVEIINN